MKLLLMSQEEVSSGEASCTFIAREGFLLGM